MMIGVEPLVDWPLSAVPSSVSAAIAVTVCCASAVSTGAVRG